MRTGYCFKVAVHELWSSDFYYPPLPPLPSALDVLFFFFSDFPSVTVSSYLLIVLLSVCLSACLSACLSLSVCLSPLSVSMHKSFLLFAGSTVTSPLRTGWQSGAVKFCPSTPGKQAVINPDQLWRINVRKYGNITSIVCSSSSITTDDNNDNSSAMTIIYIYIK